MRVYFLGTGGPNVSSERQGISTLVKAGETWLLFDTGRATLQRMHECHIPVRDVSNVFYTHLHSDHISGLGDLWITGWFVYRRPAPLTLYGPPGTKRFAAGMMEAHHFDLTVRPQYEGPGADALQLHAEEFSEGIVYDRDGIIVTAFLVDHGTFVKPAYGFKVTYDGRSIVLSGDTTYCDAVVYHANGADLLIHEMAGASDAAVADGHVRKIVASHTTPEQLAAICNAARPRQTLVNHVSLWDTTTDNVLDRIRAGYGGLVEFAEDRMEVDVGEKITIR